ncbi:MAG: transcription elongation factor GreA [Minisyncoccia bacterium]
MTDQKQYISKEKHASLKEELHLLKTSKRKEIADALEFARSLGDLSENAEYKEARDHQADLEERITEIEEILASASIVSGHSKSEVSVGSTVTIQKKGTKVSQEYHIVSPSEADTSTKKISYESPLGAAMMHKKSGESFSFNTPNGKVEYTIQEIK